MNRLKSELEEIPEFHIGQNVIFRRRILAIIRRIYKVEFNSEKYFIYNISTPLSNNWYKSCLVFKNEIENMTESHQIAIRYYCPSMRDQGIYNIGISDDLDTIKDLRHKMTELQHIFSDPIESLTFQIYETSETIVEQKDHLIKQVYAKFYEKIDCDITERVSLNDKPLINTDTLIPNNQNQNQYSNVSIRDLRLFILALKHHNLEFIIKDLIDMIKPNPKYNINTILSIPRSRINGVVRDIVLFQHEDNMWSINYNLEIINAGRRQEHMVVSERVCSPLQGNDYNEVFHVYYMNCSYERFQEPDRPLYRPLVAKKIFRLKSMTRYEACKFYEDTDITHTGRHPKKTPISRYFTRENKICEWEKLE